MVYAMCWTPGKTPENDAKIPDIIQTRKFENSYLHGKSNGCQLHHRIHRSLQDGYSTMKKIPELTLSGSPRNRGRIHGETLRVKIRELIGNWKDWLIAEVKVSPDQYILELASETKFKTAIERWTPDLLEEVRGIAEGAAMDFTTIYAFQLLDEEWWFRQENRQGLQGQPRGCSSIGWLGDKNSASIVAQNMDLPDYLDGYQIVIHIKDDQSDVESLIFSTAGLLALNGINNYSIGIVCNSLSQLNYSNSGLPVAYIHRGILEKKSYSDAKSFLEKIPHATGQNFILGSPTKIIDLECSADQVTEYSQSTHSSSVGHTNHPFVNTNFHYKPLEENPQNEYPTVPTNIIDFDSKARFEVINQGLSEMELNGANLDTIKKIFSSHDCEANPVCRHSKPDSRWMTLGTSIMILDEHPQLHVCPGPPCSSRFSQFSFN
jgi:isopenicillin-N N-acyltransferase like protein